MSYNLLLNTNFNISNNIKNWKLTNCEFKNGFLNSYDNIFSIEQEIILPDPTFKIYIRFYICNGAYFLFI